MVTVDSRLARMSLGSHGTELVPSRLSTRLVTHPDVLRAFLAARHRFLADERIDMGVLAVELGIDRTSLFRWVGNRDALLAEVLWSLAAPTFDRSDADVVSTGTARVEGVLTRFVSALIGAAAFRGYLLREPSRALRILTTSSSPVQRRFRVVVETLLGEEIAAGSMATALPVCDLAYLLVRVAESCTYFDLVAGEPPSADRAATTLRAVLQPTRVAGAA